MESVFISYRHQSPDQEIAWGLRSYLENRGLNVFIDTRIHIGTKWAEEIEQQIRAADFLVVLLSQESIRSDMLRMEVKLAHEIARQPGKSIRILPTRIAFEGALPYDLAAYLDPIQYALWRSADDDQIIAEQIFSAISESKLLPHQGQKYERPPSAASLQVLANITERAGAPLPSADPRLMFDKGTMKAGSPFYVRRVADVLLENQIKRDGETIVVKGMRQMGKSSLLAAAMASAKEHHQRTFYADFQLIDAEHLRTLNSLLRHLARRIAREFKTALKPDDVWDDKLGAKDSMTDFIEEALLAEASSPILIFLDEADLIFKYPYRDHFFSLMRAWHNLRATNQNWTRLNLIIAHSTEPYLWIQDINQSPFNVGFPIRLDDFNEAEVVELNLKHGSPLKAIAEIRDLMGLIGGQPYLVRQALYALATHSRSTLAELSCSAPDDSGPFGDHLRRYNWLLNESLELRDALRQILRSNSCDQEASFQRLRASGLIRGETRHAAQMRCRLYADYFKDH